MTMPELEPGRQLTDREKAALAEDNARESRNAIERAQEAAAQDAHNGRLPGVAGVVQDTALSITAKLRDEEYHSREELREDRNK